MVDMLLSEVSADVRAERLAQWWMRHRMHLLLLVMAIILGSIGSTVWQHYQDKRGGELLLQFNQGQEMLDGGKNAEAAKVFGGIAQQTKGDVHSLARIWQARALAAAGSKDEAADILRQTAYADAGLWSDIACLRLAGVDFKAADCLNDKKTSPLAAERAQWAAAGAWASGNSEQATMILNKLIDDKTTSAAMRAHAQSWLTTVNAPKERK